MTIRRAPVMVMIPPPMIYAAVFAVGLLANRLAPWSPRWMAGEAVHWCGWVLVALGAVLAAASVGLFRLRRTTLNPAGQPAMLVTSGPFALSRNPMYVALTVEYLGAALAFGQAWPLPLLAVPLAVVNFAVIPFEEARMAGTFGEAYAEYRRRVRRWV